MELIVTIAIPFLVAVVCAWIRFQPKLNLRPIPSLGLLVVLTGSVLGHDFFHVSSGPIPITIDRLLMGGMMVAFVWLFLTGKEDIRKLNRLDYAIIALLIFSTYSTITHDWRLLNNMPASRLLFFNFMPAALYWVVRTSRLEPGDLKFIATVLGLLGIYLALTAIAEVKGLSQFVFPRYIMNSEIIEFLGRGRGPFLNPVSNGIFMTICFCCILMWWPRTQTAGRTVLMGGAILLSLGAYATLTRSVWLGLVAACGLFVWVPATRQAKAVMIIAATAAVLIVFPAVKANVFSFKRDKHVTLSEMEQSAQMRPMFVVIAWNMFKDRPVTGVGFGQYARAKYPYLQDPHSGRPLSITKGLMQHNVFLAYLTELGLVGLGLLLCMLYQMGTIAWSVWRDDRIELWARQFGLLATVSIAIYCLNGMFHDVSIIPMQNMLTFFLFGLINNIYTDSRPFQIRRDWGVESDSIETEVPIRAAA